MKSIAAFTLSLAAIVAAGAPVSDAPPTLPEGDTGLAARYPGDAGIEKDPAALFADGFEDAATAEDLRRKWDEFHHARCARIAGEPENVYAGRRALEFRVPKQDTPLFNTAGKHLKNEQDIVFLRYYSKLEKGFDMSGGGYHTGGGISAHYFTAGRASAGERADGRNKFLANFESERHDSSIPSPGPLNVYCYHPEQRDIWGDHFFPGGKVLPFSSRPHPFGAHFQARPDFTPELDRWYCYEVMLKANTPGQRDGRIAFWVDGKLIADFPNLRFRDVADLKIDRVQISLGVGKNPVRENKKWYDNVVVATSYIGPMLSPAAAGKSSESTIDDAALNFPSGTWGTCINGQTFQIEAVVSFHSRQYATYFDARKRLCVARRRLPEGPWERIAFDDYTIAHTDVHNVAVIGVCPADGTIHLAFDHHCSPLHYRVSRPGTATDPDKVEWTPALFGPTTDELVKGQKLVRVTYPAFFNAPDGRLQLSYRVGSSGNGSSHLAHYDPDKGGWTMLGAYIGNDGDFKDSQTRNAYHNGFDYDAKGRLHITWVWREGQDNSKWNLLNCHDLQYAFSDDAGRSWRNNSGEPVGVTGRKPMRVDSPQITVQATPWRWGLMNQLTQTVDERGRVHVVLWQNPPDAPAAARDMNNWRYLHYWRDEQGRWQRQQLPFVGRKPSIVADKAGNLFVVFTKPASLEYHGADPGGPLHIFTASASQGWTDWRQVFASEKPFVGEPRVDKARWQEEGALSIYAQETPAEPGKPSALRVMDLRPATGLLNPDFAVE